MIKTIQARLASAIDSSSHQPSQDSARQTDDAFLKLAPLIQRVLRNRNIHRSAQLDHRLNQLLAPSGLKDIDLAANRLVQAITQDQSILIVGDYDVDGATATALAISSLREMGAKQVSFAVPNRFRDGYGLSLKLATKIGKTPPALLITVDNGISSIDGIAYLNTLGVDVLVTDHHLAGDVLPDAYAIVNPNQPGCKFKSKALAGVGVMFYLLLAVNAVLRENGYYAKQGLQADVLAGLDLVALGTVADVVPLDRNNRILVAQGVARMRAGRTRPGIIEMMQIAKRDIGSLTSQDLGFVIGPRLNAAGRLDDISAGIACLLAEDSQNARHLAAELDTINHERKNIEQTMLKQAMQALQKIDTQAIKPNENSESGMVLYDASWHEGVIGLLASRIKDKTGLPVLVFAAGESSDGEAMLKGSARSITGVHIRDVLANIEAMQPGLIIRFGGHAMAAGLSIAADNLQAFKTAFEAETIKCLKKTPPSNIVLSDGGLEQADVNLSMASELKTFLPWGQSCPEPQFDGEFEVLNVRFVGQIHLKLVLRMVAKRQPAKAHTANAQVVDAICFRYIEPDDEQAKRAGLALKKINAVYRLDVNEFRGKQTVQLIISQIEAI